jgi:hypothetical protein
MIKVVNKHLHKASMQDFYIGRGSVLGNKFTHKDGTKAEHIVTTRYEAIKAYAQWLDFMITHKDPKVCEALNAIYKYAKSGDINLVCYCKPHACHGDVIKELIESKLQTNERQG